MVWPSTNANYAALENGSPSAALAMAYAFRADLIQAQVGGVQVDGASFNGASLNEVLRIVDRDIIRLNMKANRQGIPRLVPLVRCDPIGHIRNFS